MARIPDVRTINREVPNGPTVQVPFAGAQGEALTSLGTAIANTGIKIEEVQNRQAGFDAAKAEADFITKKTQLDASFENDPDYATIPQRYAQGLKEIQDEIGNGLSNSRARGMFDLESQRHTATGVARIQGVAAVKEKDFERGALDQRGLNLRDIAVQGDMDGAVASYEKLLQGAFNTGVIGAEELVKRRDTFKLDTAKGRLMFLPPEARIEALSQPWANNLPPDVHADLMRQAESQNITSTAQIAAEGFIKKGLGPGAANVAIDAMPDPKMRAETRTQYDQLRARQHSARVQNESDLLDKYGARIAMGEIQISDIPRGDQLALGSSLQSLIAMQKNGVETQSPYARYSEPTVIDNLNRLLSTRDFVNLRGYFNQHRAALTSTDYANWSKVSMTGEVPPEVHGMLNAQQTLVAKMVDAGVDPMGSGKKKVETLNNQLNEWMKLQQQLTGKMPTDIERDKHIDKLLMVDPRNDGYFKTYRNFESAPNTLTLESIQQVDPEGYRRTLRLAKPGATPEQLVKDYKELNGLN